MARFQRFLQCGLVDQATTGAVDNPDTRFCLRKGLGRQDIAGLVGERRVHGDEIGARQQIIQRHFLDTHFNRALLGQERIIGDDLHAQADGAFGYDRTDIAGADQAERLAGQLDTHEFRFFPFPSLG